MKSKAFFGTLLLFACLSAVGEWNDATPGGLSVKLTSGFPLFSDGDSSVIPDHWKAQGSPYKFDCGSVSLRFCVTNASASAEPFTLRVPYWSSYRWAQVRTAKGRYFSVSGIAPAGGATNVTITPPDVGGFFSGQAQIEDASGVNADLPSCIYQRVSGVQFLSYPQHRDRSSVDEGVRDFVTPLLLSPGVGKKEQMRLQKLFSRGKGCRFGRPEKASDWARFQHWTDFTPYAAVVLAPGDADVLPSAARAALADYAFAGGYVHDLGKDAAFDRKKLNASINRFSHTSPSFGVPGAAERERELKGATPVTLLLALLAAFAVLAGPVTLWVLAWRRRRLAVFVVVPALSVLFALVILVANYALIGFVRVSESYVRVQVKEGRALVERSDVFWSPLRAAGTLRLPEGAYTRCLSDQGQAAVTFEGGGRRVRTDTLTSCWPVRFDSVYIADDVNAATNPPVCFDGEARGTVHVEVQQPKEDGK